MTGKAIRFPGFTTIFSGLFLLLPPLLIVMPKAAVPLVLLCSATAVVRIGLERRRPALPDRLILALLSALFLWAAVSCFWATDPSGSLFRLLRVVAMVLAGLILIGESLSLGREEREVVARWIVAGFFLGFALLVAERFSGAYLHYSFGYQHPDRAVFSGLNRAATSFAILVWPVTLLVARTRAGRWAYLLPAVVLAALLTLVSHAAILGFAAGLVVAVTSLRFRQVVQWLLILAPLVVLLGTPPAVGLLKDQDLYGQGLIKHSGAHRLYLWSFYAERIEERPLLGWGFNGSRQFREQEIEPTASERFRVVSHPHNALVQIRMELGVVGSAVAVALLILLVRRAERLPRATRAVAQAVFASSFTVASLSYGIWQSQWLATLLAMALLVLLSQASEPGRERGGGSPEPP